MFEPKARTIYLASANDGCKPNVILSAQLAAFCARNGHRLTDRAAEADFLIVNTCGATDWFESFTLQALRELLSSRKPGARIAAVGCLSKIDRGALAALAPDLEILTDPANLDAWLMRTARFAECAERCLDSAAVSRYQRREAAQYLLKRAALAIGRGLEAASRRTRLLDAENARLSHILDEFSLRNMVYVEIGTGCSNRCHYCVIKKAKGDTRSRPIAEILAEVERVYEPGKVLSLVMEDCGSYGADTGESLFRLVRAIGKRCPDFPIDLCYLNPRWLLAAPKTYARLFATARIKSVNLSLQSGATRVVRLMNREYEVPEVLRLLREIKRQTPALYVWTHFIVGYPGETWSEFYTSLKATKHFDFFFAFAFSPREGAPAALLPNNNAPWVRILRRMILHAVLALRLSGRLLSPRPRRNRPTLPDGVPSPAGRRP